MLFYEIALAGEEPHPPRDDRHQDAGFLTRATVVNSDNAVVALIGSLPDIAIGTTLPTTLPSTLRRTPLTMRAESVGARVYLDGSIEIDPTPSDGSSICWRLPWSRCSLSW